MKHILIVEDSPDSQMMIEECLRGEIYRLAICASAREALELAENARFEMAIIDLALPDGDGLDLLAKLRAKANFRQAPVLILTGKQEISCKVAAFSLGAEDYVQKPFHPLELKARVEARLRRHIPDKATEENLRRGSLRIEVPTHRVFVQDGGGERPVKLTPREFRILYQLAKLPEIIFKREQILDSVWGPDSEVFDRTVDAHICSIRKKLGTLGRCIESVPGEGYRFHEVRAASTLPDRPDRKEQLL